MVRRGCGLFPLPTKQINNSLVSLRTAHWQHGRPCPFRQPSGTLPSAQRVTQPSPPDPFRLARETRSRLTVFTEAAGGGGGEVAVISVFEVTLRYRPAYEFILHEDALAPLVPQPVGSSAASNRPSPPAMGWGGVAPSTSPYGSSRGLGTSPPAQPPRPSWGSPPRGSDARAPNVGTVAALVRRSPLRRRGRSIKHQLTRLRAACLSGGIRPRARRRGPRRSCGARTPRGSPG